MGKRLDEIREKIEEFREKKNDEALQQPTPDLKVSDKNQRRMEKIEQTFGVSQ
jgi:hypothetical protein